MKPVLASAPDPIPLSEWDPYLHPRPESRAAPVAPVAPHIPEPVAERLTELEAFCLRAGRRPVHGVLDPQEASLAGWMHLIRRRRAWRPYIDNSEQHRVAVLGQGGLMVGIPGFQPRVEPDELLLGLPVGW
jgi:hypothetical protein